MMDICRESARKNVSSPGSSRWAVYSRLSRISKRFRVQFEESSKNEKIILTIKKSTSAGWKKNKKKKNRGAQAEKDKRGASFPLVAMKAYCIVLSLKKKEKITSFLNLQVLL